MYLTVSLIKHKSCKAEKGGDEQETEAYYSGIFKTYLRRFGALRKSPILFY